MPKTERLSVKILHGDNAVLECIAQAEGEPVAVIARRIIRRAVREHTTQASGGVSEPAQPVAATEGIAMQRKPRNPAPSADPEAVLFSRLVERILSWPCPQCGKSGLCECYRPRAARPETGERKESGHTE